MKTRYKYIRFEESVNPDCAWLCYNNRSGHILASIAWEKRWKQYVATFDEETIWSRDCLRDVIEFMEQLTPPGGD